jgi:hypothetical protein
VGIADDCFEFPRLILENNLYKIVMFADEQVIMADDENTMQRALYEMYKIKKQL